jgi:hypothetical protein
MTASTEDVVATVGTAAAVADADVVFGKDG